MKCPKCKSEDVMHSVNILHDAEYFECGDCSEKTYIKFMGKHLLTPARLEVVKEMMKEAYKSYRIVCSEAWGKKGDLAFIEEVKKLWNDAKSAFPAMAKDIEENKP